jgi:hypothetical protein
MSRTGWTVCSLGIVAALGMIGVITGGLSGGAAVRSSRTATTGAEEWNAQLASLDHALGANDVGRAVRAWRDAYGAALGSRRWEPMFAVGQAALRIAESAGTINDGQAPERAASIRDRFRSPSAAPRDPRVDPAVAPLSRPDARSAAPPRRRELRGLP